MEISKIKESVRNWLKDPYNRIFLGIFILGVAIRLYYFFLTKDQAIWWDEGDYMAYAKALGGYTTYWMVSDAHNSLFIYFVAALFKIGFSDPAIKFILEILPSILLIWLTYATAVLMFKDKKVGLIASFLMATFWVVLFNSMRFHLGVPGLFFGLLAIYVFWQGYEGGEKIFGKINPNWAVPLTVLFVVLSYSMRRGYFLFGFFFFFYMLITRKWSSLLKDKYNWIALAVFIVSFSLLEKFVFASNITEVAGIYLHTEIPFNLFPFQIFPAYFSSFTSSTLSILLYLFWLGFILLLINTFLSLDYFRKVGKSEIKSELFAVLSIIIVLSYFLFYQRHPTDIGEPRWFFPLLFGSLICLAKGAIFIYDNLKKYNKQIALVIILVLLAYGAFYEVQHADTIIKSKISSFNGVKDASFYIKDRTSPSDKTLIVLTPQFSYYAERQMVSPAELVGVQYNQDTTFEEVLPKIEEDPAIRFLLISFWEPNHPDWMKRESQQKWEIPFMDTTIDFNTGQQDIKQEKSYGSLTFKLSQIFDGVFVYEILRN
ncbi:MAG: hypothetical protein ABIE22_02130 [archaeon]